MKNILQFTRNKGIKYKTRISNIQLTIANSFVMLTSFILIPVILETYGINFLGIFSLIVSLNAIIPLLDLGFCNALSNAISRSTKLPRVKNQENKIRLNFLLFPGVFFIFIGGIALLKVTTLYKMFDGTLSVHNLRALIILMTIHSIMLIVFNVAYKIRLAQNEFRLTSLILMINSLVILFSSTAIMMLNYDFYIFIYTYTLSSWVTNLVFLPKALTALKKANYDSRSASIKVSSRLGYLPGSSTFFAIQLSSIIAYQLDNFIVAKYFSLADVAIYSTALKFVAFPIAILASYSLPLWTHTSLGLFGSNKQEIFNNLGKILKVRILFIGPFGILLFMILPSVIKVWSAETIILPPFLAIWLILWMITSVVTQPIAMVTNGMFYQRFILVSGVFGSLVNFLVSIVLCMKFNLIAGPVIGSITAQVISSLFPFLFISKKMRKSVNSNL
jgi:O-antigen/teichoic acid export membrane protein